MAKNSKVAHEYAEHGKCGQNMGNAASSYWFGPLESNTLPPALRFVLLADCRIGRIVQRSRLVYLILASG
jgi:hypothetical protein